jgi:type IV pilus assembly protein PilE
MCTTNRRLRRVAQGGVTLIELMVVIMIISILASIAIPSYRSYAQRANRTDAKTALMRVQAAQEKFFLQANAYSNNLTAAPPGGLGLPAATDNGLYSIALNTTSNVAYTATATPVSGKGQESDSKCASFTLDQSGTRTSTGSASSATCWR